MDEYYHLVIRHKLKDKDGHPICGYASGLVLSKVFTSQAKAEEYYGAWLKHYQGYINDPYDYHHNIEKVSLDPYKEDNEIDYLMYERLAYKIIGKYYPPRTEFNDSGKEKIEIMTVGDYVNPVPTSADVSVFGKNWECISMEFIMESTPATLRMDAEDAVKRLAESPWIEEYKKVMREYIPLGGYRGFKLKINNRDSFIKHGICTITADLKISAGLGNREFIV